MEKNKLKVLGSLMSVETLFDSADAGSYGFSLARLSKRLPSNSLRKPPRRGSTFLILSAEYSHHRRIRQRGCISQRSSLSDIPKQATHDLAAAGLRQFCSKEDDIWTSDGA